jgi:hypothetical protein
VPEENPYKPPTAPVRDTGPPPSRSLTLAVLAGLAVGVGGTILSRLIVAIVYVTLTDRGGSPQSAEALAASVSTTFVYLAALGCLCSGVGGYVCARVARRHERRVTVVLAALSTAIGFSMVAGTLAVLVHTLTFACVMVGGGVGRYRNLADKRKTLAAIAA